MKYAVYGTYYATVREVVEANSEEEAKGKFSGWPSLCHQCARELDIGDFTGDIEVELVEE